MVKKKKVGGLEKSMADVGIKKPNRKGKKLRDLKAGDLFSGEKASELWMEGPLYSAKAGSRTSSPEEHFNRERLIKELEKVVRRMELASIGMPQPQVADKEKMGGAFAAADRLKNPRGMLSNDAFSTFGMRRASERTLGERVFGPDQERSEDITKYKQLLDLISKVGR